VFLTNKSTNVPSTHLLSRHYMFRLIKRAIMRLYIKDGKKGNIYNRNFVEVSNIAGIPKAEVVAMQKKKTHRFCDIRFIFFEHKQRGAHFL